MGGPTIPGYRFVQTLGSGGFADVHLYELYEQERPSQQVAIKVVRSDVPLTEREKAMFAAEADAMVRLGDHPNIVSVVTAGTTSAAEGARPYLVMRYCPPPDLGARVQAQPMSVPDAISTGIKLASALETAHRSGIIHRDIKPANVLVTPSHEPALTDFAIAGRMQELEGDHEVRISYPWSPPELLDGRSNGSVASDVYSLGATIWNLLVGRSPFSTPNGDNSSRGLSARILHSPPPATQRPDVPPALDQLLTQCLSKTPEHRPASALELARSLQRIETRSGLTRTSIAVEGDPPDGAVPVRSADDDRTRPKPVSVVSGAGPHDVTGPPAPAARPERRAPVSSTVWWSVAAVVLVALAGLLVWRAASAGDSRAQPGITSPTTRATAAPGVVPRPTVSAHRSGDRVFFRWRASDTPQAGDTFQWRVPSRGGATHLTNGTTATVRSAGRVCLQVRLERAGLPPSVWASGCA